MTNKYAASFALVASTLAFSVCFASWVINGVLVTYLVDQGIFTFDETQVGWLLALPILIGAMTRLPLGMLTDRVGGRKVFIILLLILAIAMYFVSQANNYEELLIANLGIGLAGGSFAVGIGYISVWYTKKHQGTALGIFGMGNAGAAATTLFAPQVLEWLTEQGAQPEAWRELPQLYAGLLTLTAIAFFIFTRERRSPDAASMTIIEQLAPLGNMTVWRYGLYYFLVFGGFVALAQWIVPYSVNVYQISLAQAGMLATVFTLPSGIVRAAGDWLSDYFDACTVLYWVFVSTFLVCILLSVLPGQKVASPTLLTEEIANINYSLNIGLFATLLLLIGIATGIGKAAVYKLIPEQFPNSTGIVGGMVGMLGALGGFFLPFIWAYVSKLTGLLSSCWLILALLSLMCLIWMYIAIRDSAAQEPKDLVLFTQENH